MYEIGAVVWAAVRAQANEGAAAADANPTPAEALDARNSRRVYIAPLLSVASPYLAMDTLSSLHRSPSPPEVKLILSNGRSDTMPKKLL